MTTPTDVHAWAGEELGARAKVNLALAVTRVREDGYHELRSVFLRLELADALVVTDVREPGTGRDPSATADDLVIEGDPECPVADNLVTRAIEVFRHRLTTRGIVVLPVSVRLRKRIPMAAGLAGGSTDAAAMLRWLAGRYPDALTRAELMALAAGIGSDVPFFLDDAGAALVSGAGELVEPLPPPIEPVGLLLLTPPTGSPTPAVFRAWDAAAADPDVSDVSSSAAADAVDLLAHQLRAGLDAVTLAGGAHQLRDANDLWLPATLVTPGLVSLRDELEQHLARPVLFTGSGSTLFGLYPSPAAARDGAAALAATGRFGELRSTATASTAAHAQPDFDRRDP